MRELNKEEMDLVSGAFLPALVTAWNVVSPFVYSALLSTVVYSVKKCANGEEITGNGLMISASFGSVGGVGTVLGKATGSAVGQVLWKANTAPITMAGQEIAAQY